MALPGFLFLIFTTSQIISAAPNCTLDTFRTCLMPAVSYFMDPEKQNRALTDQEYRNICRIGMSFADCYKDFTTRCATGAWEAQEFAVKTVQLIRKCDNPSFASDWRTLSQCTETLNRTKSRTLACSNAARRGTKNDSHVLFPNENGGRPASKRWNRGVIFDSLCCTTKYFGQCRGSEVNDKCGSQAEQVFHSVQKAVLDAYGCNAQTSKCPTRPDPSPEDYKMDSDIMAHFFDGIPGGSASVSTRLKTSASNLVHASYTTAGLVIFVKTLLSSRWIL